ncbi:MAG: glucose-1-phosphate adenylyltransferase subunit GlgD [Erysipelotrichaceae bacterium]|nr:glucose-1-phosphate adenylyltransferase subunit GlgD [Erysipelotrichaceae bacterium]
MRKVTAIVNFHCEPNIAPITNSRPLGSTSFLGRYAFCDFALSNLCNSGVTQVGLLVKDHLRSIMKHLGSMDSWVINTKIGHQRLMFNEPAQKDPRLNSDVNNLLFNDWLLYDSDSQYLLFTPSYLVASIDFRPYLNDHLDHQRQITILASTQRNLKTYWHGSRVLDFDENGQLVGASVNEGQFLGQHAVSLDTFIINRPTLIDILRRYAPTYPDADLFTLIMLAIREKTYAMAVRYFDGYVGCVDSFAHYAQLSFDMLDRRKADQLFHPDWPIYTLTHDTPPAMYGENSSVSNSYISNGAKIEGKVINSIIARNVTIAKGAIVKNSIIFSTVKVNEGAVIENAVIDKYSIIERGHGIKGKPKEPMYVAQGAIL